MKNINYYKILKNGKQYINYLKQQLKPKTKKTKKKPIQKPTHNFKLDKLYCDEVFQIFPIIKLNNTYHIFI